MAMTKEELKIIIEEGEGYRIEFKERVSDLVSSVDLAMNFIK
ncbi:MAG: hypothetical protein ABIF11_02130 [Nitrospirota bacterium]